jgi:hypothetical protein
LVDDKDGYKIWTTRQVLIKGDDKDKDIVHLAANDKSFLVWMSCNTSHYSVLEIRFIVNKAAANSVSKTAAAVGKVRAHPLQ